VPLPRVDGQGSQRVVQWLSLDAGEELAVEGASPVRAGDGKLVPSLSESKHARAIVIWIDLTLHDTAALEQTDDLRRCVGVGPGVRAIRKRVALEHGAQVEVNGHSFHTFPTPSALLAISELDGVPSIKLERLHAVARAAADGWLSREHLLMMPVADELTNDDVTRYALAVRYDLPEPAEPSAVQAITDSWRPYRMWAVVLLHTWLRSKVAPPRRANLARRGVPASRGCRRQGVLRRRFVERQLAWQEDEPTDFVAE